MTFLLICLGLWILSSLFAQVAAARQREILTGIFISEYHKRSGIWLSREQAVALIQLAYATIPHEERRISATEQQRRARSMVQQVCREAEKNFSMRGDTND